MLLAGFNQVQPAMDDEQAFLFAIEADRYDTLTRRIYADWLDENDRPEDADEQRRMATAELCEADQWLHSFATNVGLDYETVMEAADSDQVEVGENSAPQDALHPYDGSGGQSEAFWRYIEIVVGRKPPHSGSMPFMCCM